MGSTSARPTLAANSLEQLTTCCVLHDNRQVRRRQQHLRVWPGRCTGALCADIQSASSQAREDDAASAYENTDTL